MGNVVYIPLSIKDRINVIAHEIGHTGPIGLKDTAQDIVRASLHQTPSVLVQSGGFLASMYGPTMSSGLDPTSALYMLHPELFSHTYVNTIETVYDVTYTVTLADGTTAEWGTKSGTHQETDEQILVVYLYETDLDHFLGKHHPYYPYRRTCSDVHWKVPGLRPEEYFSWPSSLLEWGLGVARTYLKQIIVVLGVLFVAAWAWINKPWKKGRKRRR